MIVVPKPWLKGFYALLGVGAALNGLWMLLAPVDWFSRIPGVTHTGPLNLHLVRDLGGTYLLLGLILLVAWARGGLTRALHLWVLLFFLFHAALHVWDLFAGRLGREHWRIDFPGVFLPVLLLAVFSLPFAWKQEAPP